MDSGRAALAWALGVIFLLSLATGPQVGVLDVPAQQTFGGGGLGEGNASITAVEFDGRVRFEAGAYGTDVYHLRASSISLRVADVTERPMLLYKLTVPELGYSRQTNVVLDRSRRGPMTVDLAPDTFDRGAIDQETYRGTVRLVVRGAGPDRTVFERNVTIEVAE
jgi:hypothetical protein